MNPNFPDGFLGTEYSTPEVCKHMGGGTKDRSASFSCWLLRQSVTSMCMYLTALVQSWGRFSLAPTVNRTKTIEAQHLRGRTGHASGLLGAGSSGVFTSQYSRRGSLSVNS
jgi:hypothetical protein